MSDRKSVVNDWGRSILEARYYTPEDKTAEDVFWRVARVCSIPDVIDKLLDHPSKDAGDYSEIFDPYGELVKNVVFLRTGTSIRNTSLSKDSIVKTWEDETWKYYDVIRNLDFMPASPTLLNAGRKGTLSSCFFIRVKDSLEDIFQTVKDNAIIMKMGVGSV
jgi:ribonucleotide reductase alpha subunit